MRKLRASEGTRSSDRQSSRVHLHLLPLLCSLPVLRDRTTNCSRALWLQNYGGTRLPLPSSAVKNADWANLSQSPILGLSTMRRLSKKVAAAIQSTWLEKGVAQTQKESAALER